MAVPQSAPVADLTHRKNMLPVILEYVGFVVVVQFVQLTPSVEYCHWFVIVPAPPPVVWVKTTEPPVHIVVMFALILTVGSALTVTCLETHPVVLHTPSART